jgi:hypothetical protein
VQLSADAVLAFIDSKRLLIFERAGGRLLQSLDEPSTSVRGACLVDSGIVDVCSGELRYHRSTEG